MPKKWKLKCRTETLHNTNAFEARWNLEENGISIAPENWRWMSNRKQKGIYVLPIQKPQLKEGATYLTTVSFHSKEATQWAPKGFELCWDQLELPWIVPAVKKMVQHQTNPLKVMDNEQHLIVSE